MKKPRISRNQHPPRKTNVRKCAELDIVIPVYNEGQNIVPVLDALRQNVKTPFRLLICYDFAGDNTLPAIEAYPLRARLNIELVKNPVRGPHSAVMAGFRASTAPAVLVYPADDDYNPPILDKMMAKFREGNDIVAASRFIPGGGMENCPWLKAFLVRTAGFTLHHFAGIPIHDSSNGFRLFSQKVIRSIPIESTQGFTYSLEYLVKVHRLGWKMDEVAAKWFERQAGQSRFRIGKWLGAYLRWYFFAFATTYLRKKPSSIQLNN